MTSTTGTYTLDPEHSLVGFQARQLGFVRVRGGFKDFAGSFVVDASKPSASVARLDIRVASLDTENEKRDEHLRSDQFLDAVSHPDISYTSTSVQQLDSKSFCVVGDLTIAGVTKPIRVDWQLSGVTTDMTGQTQVTLTGTASLSRSDFGIKPKARIGRLLISEKIELEFQVSAIKGAE
ncbi:YceI family protein [Streptomyces sp. NBC_01356]|uniref:YceI family protein n=1 Tax=Streptomyces sp. NBC_01356 TaxID=2903836 RepID=UPI002E2EFB99|nr:YceI family protein [Streptomyces sp. NBC_01356]